MPMSCLSAVVFQNIGDKTALTSYYCGLDPVVNPEFTSPTYYRTLTADAAGMITPCISASSFASVRPCSYLFLLVWTTTPSDSYTPHIQTSSTTVGNTKVSSLSTPSATRQPSSSTFSTTSSTSSSNTASPGESTLGKTGTQTSTSTSSSTTSSLLQSANSSSTSTTPSHTDQIAIGIGVGLGVPLVLIAALAWLCPHPLRRLKSKVETAVSKSELPAQHTTYPPNSPWAPEMRTLQNPTAVPGGAPDVQPPIEIHWNPRGELYAYPPPFSFL